MDKGFLRTEASVYLVWDALKPPWWVKPLYELLDNAGVAGEARTGRIIPGELIDEPREGDNDGSHHPGR